MQIALRGCVAPRTAVDAPNAGGAGGGGQGCDAATWTAAQELETAFLAEMLGHAGLDEAQGPFAGGVGAQQFASLLRQAHAGALVQAGGIGLAQRFYLALRAGAAGDG